MAPDELALQVKGVAVNQEHLANAQAMETTERKEDVRALWEAFSAQSKATEAAFKTGSKRFAEGDKQFQQGRSDINELREACTRQDAGGNKVTAMQDIANLQRVVLTVEPVIRFLKERWAWILVAVLAGDYLGIMDVPLVNLSPPAPQPSP